MNTESRSSESPTRTIDSNESASISVETIVDRNISNESKLIQQQTAAMANSTNATNNYSKNSLTNSQISMISNDQKDSSHIYTSPDLIRSGKDTKPILEAIIDESSIPVKELPKSKEISSKVFVTEKKNDFPKHILFGVIQFALSIALVALGGLLLARGASLATTGSGIWSGAIAAIAGALSVINMKSAQTGFLAVSLICVASSTLAMALTGSGLVRDINRLDQEELNHSTIKAAISAGSGLIFALTLHLVISILSVYQSATKICSRGHTAQMLDNVITVNNATMVTQQKVEEYFQSMAHSQLGREKMMTPENCDKLMAMWMYTAKHGPHHHHHGKTGAPQSTPRPVMLVPAGNGMAPPLGYRHPSGLMLAPGMIPSPMSLPYPGLQLPMLPNGTTLHPDDMKTLYRLRSSPRTISEISKRHRQRRSGKNEASKRQRRRSESDAAENGRAFTYTGLDRAIADNFLKQQEQSNSSHLGYSSGESSRDGCPDVAM